MQAMGLASLLVLLTLAATPAAGLGGAGLERYKLRQKRQIGRSCQFSTDCFRGGYCDDRKTCQCLSTYVAINGACTRKVNPGESGCANSQQCSAVWPDAFCNSGVCKCGNNQPSFQTADGPVCLNTGFCPINGPNTKLLKSDGTTVSCSSGLDQTCWTAGARGYECICGGANNDCANSGINFCCPSRALACVAPPDAGSSPVSGGGSSVRYYYNSQVGDCQTFSYRGDKGNANNFQSLDQCRSYCMQSCNRGQPLYSAFNPPATVKGSPIFCSGSGSTCSNSNYECTKPSRIETYLCCPKASYVCSKNGGLFGGGNNVATNYDPGLPTGSSVTFNRWYFDESTQRCQSFTFTGQGGNFNNFGSESECSSFCAQVNCVAGNPLKANDGITNRPCNFGGSSCPSTHTCTNGVVCCPNAQYLCALPVAVGGGFQNIQRFYYNSATRACQQFTYTGTQGNDNNFATYSACVSFCSNVVAGPSCPQGDPLKDSSGNVLQCNDLSRNIFSSTGTTYTCQTGYTCVYDATARASGCCADKTTTCALSFDAGVTCAPSVTRWYYNTVNARCDSFSYNGCGGNSNNFATQNDCEAYCGGGGCPDGGQPARNAAGAYIACGGSNFCPSQHTCNALTIPSSGASRSLCCPTKEYVCSLPRSQGNNCGSSSVVRYYFNTITKQCESFTFGGCAGNRNNFRTILECQNYCNSAGCPAGQVVQVNSGTQVLVTCTASATTAGSFFGNTCGTGFSCVYSQLLGRGICCGSTAPVDQCPSGQLAYMDAATNAVRQCTVNTVGSCPSGFVCYYSPTQRQSACCGASVVQCPSGGSAYIDPVTNGPRQCVPGRAGACPSGTTCQATGINIAGVPSTTGYCCGVGTNYCGSGYTLATLPGSPGVPIQCRTNVVSTCPSPSICKAVTSVPVLGGTVSAVGSAYCCIRTAASTVNVCQAFPGEVPYVVNGAPVICNTAFDPTRCPQTLGYQCRPYTPNNNYYCCMPATATVSPNLGGCPPGYNPLLTAGAQKVRCSAAQDNGVCPPPRICQYSAADRAYICCTNGQVITPTTVCPNGQAPYTNPVSRQFQTCSAALVGRQQQCPAAHGCVFVVATGRYYCCPGFQQTTSAPVSTDGCPAGRQAFIYPGGNRTPLSCRGIGQPCPNGYECVSSLTYPGQFQCCTRLVGRRKRHAEHFYSNFSSHHDDLQPLLS